jgi:hypothetical protein
VAIGGDILVKNSFLSSSFQQLPFCHIFSKNSTAEFSNRISVKVSVMMRKMLLVKESKEGRF